MKHQTISFIKSAIRLVGYIAIWRLFDFGDIKVGLAFIGGLLILSEFIGIVEEIGHE